MSHKANDILVDDLVNWLSEYSASKEDILFDENGEAFILVEGDNGNPGEDGYSVSRKKVYIPENYQDIID